MPGPQNAGLVGGSYYSGTLSPAPAPAPSPVVGQVSAPLSAQTVDTARQYIPQTAPTISQPAVNAGQAAFQGQSPAFANPPQPVQGQAQGGNPLADFPGAANAQALENAGYGQLDAQLNALRQQAIINYGDPALAQMAGFGLDPQAGAFAQQNYLAGNSTKARLDHQHQLNSQAIINALAAHGILNSGDLGYREGQEGQNYGNNIYDAQHAVLQQLTDAYNTYLGNRNSLHSNTIQAQLQALQAYLANPDAYTSLAGGGAATSQGAAATTVPATATGKTTKSTAATRALTYTHIGGVGGHY